jgi:glycyl-tRNA synthetase beta chain
LCLLDGEVLPLALGDIPVGRATRGHRFLAPEKICVGNAADYVARLADAHVILDRERRREMIATGLDEAASKKGFRIRPDLGLLEEVTGLAEFPVVLMGSIDAGYVAPPPEGLPPEVLATAMRTHQKYFSCQYPDGSTAPFFLFVANNRTDDGGATIIAGNERVLRARLADARFFWDQDGRIRLEDRLDALKDRVFHAKLGSVYDKAVRIEQLADFLARRVPGADPKLCRPAARLAKADLSTGLVGEFPELQGVMGQYYYRQETPSDPRDIIRYSLIATAIGEHYRPLGPGDRCPRSPESIVVALADKVDSLVAFFAVGEEPTGSRDPYALRRAALGVIRIIVENQVRLELKAAFTTAAEIFYRERKIPNWEDRVPGLCAKVMNFVVDRLKVHLRDQGVRHDLIAAAFAQVGVVESDLVRLRKRVDALGEFLAGDDGTNLLTAYRRASNIVRIEDEKDGRLRSVEVDPSRLELPGEKALGRGLDQVAAAMQAPLDREDFEAVMGVLAQLRRPVDEFFDNVTVNTSDESLRENRLRLLARVRAEMNRVADFSQIEG